MRPSVLALLFACAALGCAEEEAALPSLVVEADTLPGGIPIIRNTLPAPAAGPRWTIEPEVVIGAVDGTGPDVFGRLHGIAPLSDGRIAVLEAQAMELRIFSPDGTHFATYGQQGEGPGEFLNVNAMLAGSDDLIRVNDSQIRRLSVFHPDQGFVSSERTESTRYLMDSGIMYDARSAGDPWEATIGSDNRIHEYGWAPIGNQGSIVIKTYDAAGRWADTIRIEPYPNPVGAGLGTFNVATSSGVILATSVPFWPRGVRALDPAGFIWDTPRNSNEYRIVQRSFAGDTIRIVTASRSAMPVTPAERDSAIARVEERTGPEPIDWSRIPDEKPLILGLSVDDAGRLWVQVDAGDTLMTYDVFDREGGFEGTAVTTLRLDGWVDPVIVGDWFYAVHVNELDVPYAVRARIREVSSSN